MKKIFLITIIFLLFHCTKEHVYIKQGGKFFYYKTEGYVYLFNIPQKTAALFLPAKSEYEATNKGMLFIKRYKKVYMPGTGGTYIEAGVFILTEKDEHYSWFLVASFVDVPILSLRPLTHFGYKSRYSLINFQPSGKNFRATVKRDFKLVLEIEFSFLPTENFNSEKIAKHVFDFPVLSAKNNRPVLIKTKKIDKGNITFKEGIGAFVFHSKATKKLRMLNNAKIKKVFYFEKKFKETRKAYYVD